MLSVQICPNLELVKKLDEYLIDFYKNFKEKYNIKVSFNLTEMKECMKNLENTVIIEDLNLYTINDIENNVFKKGINIELDELQNKINLCIHCAAFKDVMDIENNISSTIRAINTNVVGTINLLYSCINKNIKFINLSKSKIDCYEGPDGNYSDITKQATKDIIEADVWLIGTPVYNSFFSSSLVNGTGFPIMTVSSGLGLVILTIKSKDLRVEE